MAGKGRRIFVSFCQLEAAMGRPPLPRSEARIKRTIRVAPGILEWIREQVRTMRFKDETHAFEYAVTKLMREEGAREIDRERGRK